MDRHERKGRAAFVAARLLNTIVEMGMVEQALSDEQVSDEDMQAIKDDIREFAQQHEETGRYHRSMGQAIKPRKEVQ